MEDRDRRRAARDRSGPLRVPGSRAADLVGRIGWLVAGFVLVLAIVLYAASHTGPRSGPSGPPAAAALPSWGPLTLAGVARSTAAAAGEHHPRQAFWLLTRRSLAIPYITGRPDASAESDYLIGMHGRFTWSAGRPNTLAGSHPTGSVMLVLVRGFDGAVRGVWVGDRNLAGVRALGIPHTLALGFIL